MRPLHAPNDRKRMQQWVLENQYRPAGAPETDDPIDSRPAPIGDKPGALVPEEHGDDPVDSLVDDHAKEAENKSASIDEWLAPLADKARAENDPEIRPNPNSAATTPKPMEAQAAAKMPKRDDYEKGGGVAAWLDAVASAIGGHNFDSGYYQDITDRGDKKFERDSAAAKQEQEKQKTESSAAHLKDPSSQESIAARQRAAPYLRELGFSDEEINGLSASDVGGIPGLMGSVSKLRADKTARDNKTTDAADALKNQETLHSANRDYDIAHPLPGKHKGGAGGGYGAPSVSGDERLTAAWGSADIPPSVRAEWESVQREPPNKRAAAETAFFGRIKKYQDDAAKPPKQPSGGDALTVDDIQGTGWIVDDPDSAARIINKRSMTKETLHQLSDAKTAIESLDTVIANRKLHGSNASGMNPALTTQNNLYIETAKQNYAKAMGMPNTDATQAELKHLFPDPNAVGTDGVAGTMLGVGAKLGVTSDPVLDSLKAARAEALHNLQSKIPIPSLRYVGTSGAHNAPASNEYPTAYDDHVNRGSKTPPASARPPGATKRAYSPSENKTYWLDASGAVLATVEGNAK